MKSKIVRNQIVTDDGQTDALVSDSNWDPLVRNPNKGVSRLTAALF